MYCSGLAAACRSRSRALAAGLLALLLAATAPAQEPLRLRPYLPADIIAYLEIPSLGQALDALKTHPLALVYQDSEMQAFLKPLLAQLEGGKAMVKASISGASKGPTALPPAPPWLSAPTAFPPSNGRGSRRRDSASSMPPAPR